MESFSQLFRRSWSSLFRDQKSFWTIAWVGIVVSGFFIYMQDVLWGGYDFSTQEGIEIFFAHILQNPNEIIKLLFFILLSLIFPLLYDFFQKNSLAEIVKWKEINFRSFFGGIRRLFPMIGTSFICGIYALMYIVPVVVVLIIIAVIWNIYLQDTLTNQELAIVFMVPSFIIITLVAVWIIVTLTMAMPAFYMDNVRYMDAVRSSRSLVKNTWWKTLGQVILIMIIAFLPLYIWESLIQILPVTDIYWVNFLITLVSPSLRIFGTMLIFTFLCTLYESYKNGGVKTIAKTVVRKPALAKKKVVVKKPTASRTKKASSNM